MKRVKVAGECREVVLVLHGKSSAGHQSLLFAMGWRTELRGAGPLSPLHLSAAILVVPRCSSRTTSLEVALESSGGRQSLSPAHSVGVSPCSRMLVKACRGPVLHILSPGQAHGPRSSECAQARQRARFDERGPRGTWDCIEHSDRHLKLSFAHFRQNSRGINLVMADMGILVDASDWFCMLLGSGLRVDQS